MRRPPSISTHVLDTERGEPAVGVPVALARWEADRFVGLSEQETNDDGRIQDLVGDTLRAGRYQIAFDVAAYFRKQGCDVSFLSKVVLEFQVEDSGRHYHVPLLLSRYSCASYRGS